MRMTTAIDPVGGSQVLTKGRQRKQIAVFVAFIIIGAAAFGLWQSYLGMLHWRQAIEHHTLGRALAAARIIDRETAAAGHVLRSLSASPALAKEDLATFYEQMRGAAPDGTWLTLRDGTKEVLNTLRPYDPSTVGQIDFDWGLNPSGDELRKRKLWISNLEYNPISRVHGVAVSARIDRPDGEMKYSLSLVVTDGGLRELSGHYRPNDVRVGIFDRNFNLIVSDEVGVEPDRSDIAVVQTLVRQGERIGSFQAGGLFGTSRIVAFAVAADSGWVATSHTNLPLLGNLPMSERLRSIGLGIVSLLLIGLGLALIANRWFDGPIQIMNRASAEAEQRLKTYWEQSSEGHYIVNVGPTGGFTYEAINPQLAGWLGASSEQVCGKSPHECLPKDVADNAVTRYQQCATSRRPSRFENRGVISGTERHWETILTPVLDSSGQRVIQLLGRSQEITERMAMQRQLNESEERLAAVARAVPGFLFVALPDGTIDYFNDHLRHYAGIRQCQSEPTKLTSLIHPDDQTRIAAMSARAAENSEPFSIECRIRSTIGDYRWHLVRAAPVQKGPSIRWFGIGIDVDDRKQLSAALTDSRHRLQSILEGISDCYFTIDRQGRIVALNERAAQWFGRSADMLVGVDYRTLGGTEFSSLKLKLRQPFHAAVEDVIARGIQVRQELPSMLYPGRWLEIQASPINDGAVLLFKDITDRKLSEQRTAQSFALVQSSLDALSARVAILDGGGFVLAINKSWQEFNIANAQASPGSNYKESCETSELRDGLIRVINGHSGFRLTYDLETGSGRRWYQATVTPFKQTDSSRILVAHEDVTEIVETRQSIAELHKRLISLQEEERQRIAIELHDSTAQYLVAATLSMIRLRDAAARIEGISDLCDEVDDLVEAALKELRIFTYLLHPPGLSRNGLKTTLERFVVGFHKRSLLPIDLAIDDDVENLPYEFQRTILRIAQEALANAHRHARATSVDIKMTMQDDKLRLVVRDDGRGMPHVSMDELAEGLQLGVGIAGMKARTDQLGGSIEFVTNSNGTSVIAAIPLPHEVRTLLRATADNATSPAVQ
jgi:PAS domain S-box-containing protein